MSTSISANVFAYSVTDASHGRRNRSASRPRTNGAARSARLIRADALGGGRVEGDVAITHKQSKGELAMQGDELSSEDEVQEVRPPRGEFQTVIPRVAADEVQWNS
jgi:hypothetical protein